jgi:hypothetical protein
MVLWNFESKNEGILSNKADSGSRVIMLNKNILSVVNSQVVIAFLCFTDHTDVETLRRSDLIMADDDRFVAKSSGTVFRAVEIVRVVVDCRNIDFLITPKITWAGHDCDVKIWLDITDLEREI